MLYRLFEFIVKPSTHYFLTGLGLTGGVQRAMILNFAVEHSAALTAYYIETVCRPEVRDMIHTLYKSRRDTVCFLTAAALVWMFTGRDLIPPFSGVWDITHPPRKNAEIHKVTAFRRMSLDSNNCFEDTLEHVLFVYEDTYVIDSHFMRRQCAQIFPMNRLEEFAHYETKTIYIEPSPGIGYRLAQAMLHAEIM
jgi:hypothetical protein